MNRLNPYTDMSRFHIIIIPQDIRNSPTAYTLAAETLCPKVIPIAEGNIRLRGETSFPPRRDSRPSAEGRAFLFI